MICPKCQDLMRTIGRGSVHIEQCENCKGVFLDGGELEQIIAAERAHYAQPYRPEGVPVSMPVPVPAPVFAPAAEPTAVVPIGGTLPVDGDVPVEGGRQPAGPPPADVPADVPVDVPAAAPVAPAAGPPPPYQPPPGTQTGPPPPYQPPPGSAPAAPPPAVYYAPQPYYPRRKRSFLEELLD
ncbi:zf-TFIIB domain-containing protein [Actinosynnema sp. CA-299493]